MTDPLKTLREALEQIAGNDWNNEYWARKTAQETIAALDALEQAMREPVMWQRRMRPTWAHGNAFWGAWVECSEGSAKDCWKTPLLHDWAYEARALYTAAPPVQQAQRPDFHDEWTGYLKDGETPFERFLRERKDVQSVLKLYQRTLEENERLKAQQPQAEAVWVNPELEHMAEEAECVSMCLNDRGVPSKDGSKPLSLWGRVEQYANPRFLEGMTTNTPIVSSEHIKTLAQVCRLIGNYTTAEFVQNVCVFAQVLLANKAVQEAFVKANTHLLYAAPQQAEAVPPNVTDAMVDAYLQANDAYWRETDTQPKSPTKWRNGNPKEATRVSLAAALAAAPQPKEQSNAACRTDGRCQYAIDHDAEKLGHCPTGKCVMPRQAETALQPKGGV